MPPPLFSTIHCSKEKFYSLNSYYDITAQNPANENLIQQEGEISNFSINICNTDHSLKREHQIKYISERSQSCSSDKISAWEPKKPLGSEVKGLRTTKGSPVEFSWTEIFEKATEMIFSKAFSEYHSLFQFRPLFSTIPTLSFSLNWKNFPVWVAFPVVSVLPWWLCKRRRQKWGLQYQCFCKCSPCTCRHSQNKHLLMSSTACKQLGFSLGSSPLAACASFCDVSQSETLSRAPGPEFTQRNTFCDGTSRAANAECMNAKKEFK